MRLAAALMHVTACVLIALQCAVATHVLNAPGVLAFSRTPGSFKPGASVAKSPSASRLLSLQTFDLKRVESATHQSMTDAKEEVARAASPPCRGRAGAGTLRRKLVRTDSPQTLDLSGLAHIASRSSSPKRPSMQ